MGSPPGEIPKIRGGRISTNQEEGAHVHEYTFSNYTHICKQPNSTAKQRTICVRMGRFTHKQCM